MPSLDESLPLLAEERVQTFGYRVVGMCSIIGIVDSMYQVCKTKKSISNLKALYGTVPIWFFSGSLFLLMSTSHWGPRNPGYGVLFFAAPFSLASSKQIVANFTHMEPDPIPRSFFWALLFILNRLVTAIQYKQEISYWNLMSLTDDSLLVPEWIVALTIFTIYSVEYLTFVTCTIDQICKLLDIHCLTIKHKKH